MHLNAHLALGAIVSFLIIQMLPTRLTFLEVVITIFIACANDIDFLFARFEKNQNHRMFFTHSIYLGLICIVVGAILLGLFGINTGTAWMVVISGINLAIHVLVDSIDWGVNLFMDGKSRGLKILLGDKTPEKFQEEARKYAPQRQVYLRAYYQNKIMVFLDMTLLSVLIFIFIALWGTIGHEYWWVFLAWLACLGYHLQGFRGKLTLNNE